jgi:hypothetical protein
MAGSSLKEAAIPDGRLWGWLVRPLTPVAFRKAGESAIGPRRAWYKGM